MAQFNGRSLLRGQVRALARPNGYAVAAEPAPQETVTRLSLDALDGAQNAKTTPKALGFECYCGIDSRTGIASFYAQLAGGKSFSCTPVMPKDLMGNPMEQPNVYNGSHGYLVLKISENAQLEENSRGQRTLTVRPEFLAFTKTLDEAKAAEAEALKPAAKQPAK